MRTPVGFSSLPGKTDTQLKPDLGLRTFGEINASMASLTTVPITTASVNTLYQTIEQQLPSQVNIEGFVSSHQMAVTQLAIGYCNALVEDTAKVSNVLPSLKTTQGPAQAFTNTDRTNFISDMYSAFIGDPALTTTPTLVDFADEHNALLTRLIDDCPSCANTPARTRTIAKASCAATLGSAVTLIH